VRPAPFLFAISERRLLDTTWEAWCTGLDRLGVDSLQVRERDLDDRALLDLVLVARRNFPPPHLLMVNRRFDLALAAGTDGVHLPSRGLPVAVVRAALPETTIGVSTHSIEEVSRARADGADYAVFGPVFPTPSKIGGPAPRGLEKLAAAAELGLPVVAVGGIDARNVGAVLESGASGVAAIRAFSRPESAAELCRAARETRR